MKIKTSELTGPALDWAVAKAQGTLGQKPSRCFDCKHYEERQGRDEAIQYCHHPKMDFVDGSEAFGTWPSDYATHEKCPINELTAEPYSSDWSVGGPLIEREKLSPSPADFGLFWRCYSFGTDGMNNGVWACGPTPLIAAMRCYCASKLGDSPEVPDELA